ERKRRFQEMVSAVSRSAQPRGEYVVSMETHPGTDEFTVSVPGYAVRQGDLLTLELPGLTQGLSIVTGDDRKNPLYRPSSRKQHVTVEVQLPEGVRDIELVPPESAEYSLLGLGTFRTRSRIVTGETAGQGGGRVMSIVVEQESENTPGMVMPEVYPKLLAIHRTLSHPSMRMIVLRMEGEGN
ncbi:MAG TPA: hypothetical protein PLR71_15255, partial [Deltaproteobacteria bacterium]|nr:hypothetical protein [Deltaproteobacteria bacterium]